MELRLETELLTSSGSKDRVAPRPIRTVAIGAAVLGTATLIGVALCLMKGDGAGLRDQLGNASAPYALAAFLAGLTTKRFWSAAALGVAATEVTLGGFYWAWDALLHHEVSTYSLTTWCTAGIANGILCGIAGRIAVTHPAVRYLAPALLLLEPAAQCIAVLTGHWGAPAPLIGVEAYAIAIALGITALLMARRSIHGTRRRALLAHA